MTRIEHYYWKFVEECAEAVQRAAKSVQFGDDERQEGQDLANAARLRAEINDVLAVIRIMEEDGIILPVSQEEMKLVTELKREKIKKFLGYSVSLGKVDK